MRTVMGTDPDRPDTVPDGVIGGRFVHLPELTTAEPTRSAPGVDAPTRRATLQRALTANAGVLRDAERLAVAAEAVEAALADGGGDSVADHEVRNLATVGRAVVEAAQRRQESRGAHTRDDFPELDPAFAHRIVFA